MDEQRTHIARLEDEIEDLSLAAERCRKIDLLARITMIAGAAWLIGDTVGLIWSGPAATMMAFSAVLFGIVLYGTNRSTWQQVSGRLEAVEAQRTSLIDELDPKLVRSQSPSVQVMEP